MGEAKREWATKSWYTLQHHRRPDPDDVGSLSPRARGTADGISARRRNGSLDRW